MNEPGTTLTPKGSPVGIIEQEDIQGPPKPIENKEIEPEPEKEKTDKPMIEPEQPDEPQPKKVRWLTRAMAEEFTRYDVLVTTFREAVLFFIFVMAVTFCTIGRKSTTMFFITQAVEGQFLGKEFKTINNVSIKYEDIRSAADFWEYAESLMLDSLYWEHYYDPEDSVMPAPDDDKNILYENKLLGVPRIRQVKVTNQSCVIHSYFRRLFLTCYDLYRESDEDKLPFGPEEGTAWTHNTPEDTESIAYSGKISTYEGGGFYLDLGTNREKSAELIGHLKDNLWITRGTRAVFVDFALYNANVNEFCVCKLVLEFPPTGGVIPSHYIYGMRLMRFRKFFDYVTGTFEYLAYAIAVYYLIEEIREIIYFKLRYFLQFWTYIDLIIITLTTGNIVAAMMVFPNVGEAVKKITDNPEKYGNLEYLGKKRRFYYYFGAMLLFFSYIKIFKYLNFNQTMGQLNNTLKRCALDVLGFSIMFFIIFFAFAELGYLLFGSQVEDFSSFGVAMFTLLRTILGDFDYLAIEKANRVLAPLYFLSYIFFVFFVLLNMFLAIINDTYADVKTEIAIAPEEMQMTEFLSKGFYSLLQKCGWNINKNVLQQAEFNATIHQIRDALKKCGFSDLEIEMFFARYHIDPTATEVGDYDVKKIMKELEEQFMGRENLNEETTLVHVSDFITQQDRLENIEGNIQILATKMDSLLKKLDLLDNMHKGKAP